MSLTQAGLSTIKSYIDAHSGGSAGSGWTKVIDTDFDGQTVEWSAEVPEGTREILVFIKDAKINNDTSYGVLNLMVNGNISDFDGQTVEWSAEVPEGTREILVFIKDAKINNDTSYGVLNLMVNGNISVNRLGKIPNSTEDGSTHTVALILIGNRILWQDTTGSTWFNVSTESIQTVGVKDTYGGIYTMATGHLEVLVR